MKILLVGTICLSCALALAEENAEAETEEFHDVQIRLVTFEQIDVTAEKAPDETAEPVGDEIEQILHEADALEVDDAEP